MNQSFEFCNGWPDYHHCIGNRPYCPKCGSLNVQEQGYEHNHRHYCRDCDVIYWITRD